MRASKLYPKLDQRFFFLSLFSFNNQFNVARSLLAASDSRRSRELFSPSFSFVPDTSGNWAILLFTIIKKERDCSRSQRTELFDGFKVKRACDDLTSTEPRTNVNPRLIIQAGSTCCSSCDSRVTESVAEAPSRGWYHSLMRS